MIPRVVSLLPSATEIVCALGFQDRLVGRSHECDFPEGVEALPVCTEAKLDRAQNSRQIHDNVMEILRHDISVYRVDSELLRDLTPTHIVTQIQCDICAVSLGDVEAALHAWPGDAPRIIALNAQSLSDVYADIIRVAAALEATADGERVVAQMRNEIERIRALTAEIEKKPRVATIEWLDPLMTAGNWMPEMVEVAGGNNVFGTAGVHSPWLSFDDLRAEDPDVVIILPCGFGIDESEHDLHLLEERPGWSELRAVQSGEVYVTDGNQFFNRPGPRLADSVRILSEILHPRLFGASMMGGGWKRVEPRLIAKS